MKVLTISHSDSLGGAARAAFCLHCALRQAGIDSRMLVNHATVADWTVSAPDTTYHKIVARVGPHIDQQLCRLHKTSNQIQRSPAFIPSPWLARINQSDADIVHLHWIAADTLSMADIGKITKPIVWTMHDMWPFAGAEHYVADDRWREGYLATNRPRNDGGWDINRWVWNRKKKAWRKPLTVVGVSRWLADSAAASALMRGWPASAIANPIDMESWKPINKREARALLQIPEGKPVVAFGAWGVDQPHKGFDLLRAALRALMSRGLELELLVFGQLGPKTPITVAFPTRYAGHLHDDLSLRIHYSAADVMVVPSRIEAFGQTTSEALACGTPVVAFGATGLLDVVDHKSTGYLASPFDVDDLANGIAWVIDSRDTGNIADTARRQAIERFSYPIIAAKYRAMYEGILLLGSSIHFGHRST